MHSEPTAHDRRSNIRVFRLGVLAASGALLIGLLWSIVRLLESSSLAGAVLRCNAPAVRTLLHHGADPDARVDSSPVLLIAASRGDSNIVHILIANGASPDNSDSFGNTPLTDAAMNGHTEVVRSLIRAGAKVDRAEGSGLTPLMLAVMYGHVEIVRVLCESGADPHIRSDVFHGDAFLFARSWKRRNPSLAVVLEHILRSAGRGSGRTVVLPTQRKSASR